MGEAKRRGTFEQRLAEGIEKRDRIYRERREMERRRRDAMTPKERAARINGQVLLATAIGLMAGNQRRAADIAEFAARVSGDQQGGRTC